MKETLLSTLVHGPEILEGIRVLRQVSPNKIPKGNLADPIVHHYHPETLELVVDAIFPMAGGAKTFRLVQPTGFLPPFEAGQYLNVWVTIDGVRTSRPYSLSSAPCSRGYYEITVAPVEGGFVSTYLLNQLAVGDTLCCSSPSGTFRHQAAFQGSKLLLLGGGSGITPFVSMVRETLSRGLPLDLVLLYGVRHAQGAWFKEELEALAEAHPNFRLHLVVSHPDASDSAYEQGFLDAKRIARLVPDYAERTAFICGPEVMNTFCVEALQSLGLPARKIQRELFASKEANLGTAVYQLTVDGQTYPARADEPLLVALERAGLKVRACCRSGACSLCRVQLLEGQVHIGEGCLHRKADEAYGYIHSCKAYPLSDCHLAL